METLQQLAFISLGCAILSVWLGPLKIGEQRIVPWAALLLFACILGLSSGTLDLRGALSIGALAGATYGLTEARTRRGRALCMAAAITVALLLAVHVLPGFRNPKIIDAARISPDAVPFTQYLNFDKGAAGLILLAMYSRRVTTSEDAKLVLLVSLVSFMAITFVVMVGAVMTGLVRPDFKLPAQTAAFLAVNLLFTCIPEEAFFRGLLQEKMTQAVANKMELRWIPATASGFLFGAVHLGGGLAYCVLSMIAGIGYAVAYDLTRRVEAPIISHFAVNAIQFFAFTYPYLQR